MNAPVREGEAAPRKSGDAGAQLGGRNARSPPAQNSLACCCTSSPRPPPCEGESAEWLNASLLAFVETCNHDRTRGHVHNHNRNRGRVHNHNHNHSHLALLITLLIVIIRIQDGDFRDGQRTATAGPRREVNAHGGAYWSPKGAPAARARAPRCHQKTATLHNHNQNSS